MGNITKDIIMCKETEKLVKILQGSQNPTDMALIILANKMDDINSKIDKNIRELDLKFEKKFEDLSENTTKQIEELKKATSFSRWLDTHKKPIVCLVTILMVLSIWGVSGVAQWLKIKLGL